MINEKKLDIDLINSSKEYWDKIIYKKYDKIVFNPKLSEHKLIKNKINIKM